MSLRDRDRRLRYEKHRQKVIEAKATVDSKPPIVQTGNYIRLPMLKVDTDTAETLKDFNNKLMRNINGVNRTNGYLDTFPTPGHPVNLSRMPMIISGLQKLELANLAYAQRLLCTKASLNTRRKPTAFMYKRTVRPLKKCFEVPTMILQKYQNLKLPQNIDMLRQLLRPRIFFELAVMGFRPLGRIIVQLFTEACPEIVLEFVRICRAETAEKINFIRLFPQLWLEGEIPLEGRVLCLNRIEYDMRALDHGVGPGIMSFAARNSKCFRKTFLNFSISFKPLSVLNGQRIAFGKVQTGLKILDCLQDYGTKNGKPIRDIGVTNCGIIV